MGVVNLFREYFFEFDTFLGTPAGHIWVSPGGSVEVVETSTRRTLVEKFTEGSEEISRTVVNLCTGRRLDERLYPPALFHAPPETLMGSWQELWDIDRVDSSGWDHMVQTFRQWLSGSTIRTYHSQTTYRRTDNGLVPQGRVTRLPRVPVKGVYAEEGHAFGHAAQFRLP